MDEHWPSTPEGRWARYTQWLVDLQAVDKDRQEKFYYFHIEAVTVLCAGLSLSHAEKFLTILAERTTPAERERLSYLLEIRDEAERRAAVELVVEGAPISWIREFNLRPKA